MKIQNLMFLKAESPEICDETLTTNGLEKAATKGPNDAETSRGEHDGSDSKKTDQIPAPFSLLKKSDQNENGATTIFAGLKTKEDEKEHYNFLNEMRVRLNVDENKIIDLEARISCKYKSLFNIGWASIFNESAILFNSKLMSEFQLN
jgi:hypothetical protein